MKKLLNFAKIIYFLSIAIMCFVLPTIYTGITSIITLTQTSATEFYQAEYIYEIIMPRIFYEGFSFNHLLLSTFTPIDGAKTFYIVITLIALIAALFLLAITFTILTIARDMLKNETPFTKKNAKYTKILAFLILISTILKSNAEFLFYNLFIMPHYEYLSWKVDKIGDMMSAIPSLSIDNIIYICIIFLLHYIFNYGYQLQIQDDELL